MTLYTFKKTVEEVEEAGIEELEKEKNKQEAVTVVVALISFFGKPLFLMLLWNWLMPSIFGLAAIGYLKSFGLYLIARIIIDKND
jgi:hypothetical protein